MDTAFWHKRWETNQIGFHEGKPNVFLVRYFKSLQLPLGDRIFLPLCGKTRDIAWLLAQGLQVVGVELNQSAIEQLFQELGLTPEIETVECFTVFRTENLVIWVGDFFALTRNHLLSVDAVYDRAAMVALPKPMRAKYTQRLIELTSCARQLLVCFEYDQEKVEGPPFSITELEVLKHYGVDYVPRLLESAAVTGGVKGSPAIESVWLLGTSEALR